MIARIKDLAAAHPPRPGSEHDKVIAKTLTYLQAKQPYLDSPHEPVTPKEPHPASNRSPASLGLRSQYSNEIQQPWRAMAVLDCCLHTR